MGCKQFSANRIVPVASIVEETSPSIVVFRKQNLTKEIDEYSERFSSITSSDDDDDDVVFFDQRSNRTGLINYNGNFLLTKRNVRSIVSDSELVRPSTFSSDQTLSSPRIRSVSPVYHQIRITTELYRPNSSILTSTSSSQYEEHLYKSSVQKMLTVIATRLKSTPSILTDVDMNGGQQQQQRISRLSMTTTADEYSSTISH